MADTLDLGSSIIGCAGSNPVIGTACFVKINRMTRWANFHFFHSFQYKNFNCVSAAASLNARSWTQAGLYWQTNGYAGKFQQSKGIRYLCKNNPYLYYDIIISTKGYKLYWAVAKRQGTGLWLPDSWVRIPPAQLGFLISQRPPPPTAVAVIKGDSNSPGGFCLYRHWSLLSLVVWHCPSTVVTQVRFLQKHFIQLRAWFGWRGVGQVCKVV